MIEVVKDIFNLIFMFLIVYGGIYLFTRHDSMDERMKNVNCKIAIFSGQVSDEIKKECIKRELQQINNQKD